MPVPKILDMREQSGQLFKDAHIRFVGVHSLFSPALGHLDVQILDKYLCLFVDTTYKCRE